MTYTEEEKRAAAREALDWCAQSHGTLSAFARERGRDLESLKRWVHAYYPEELGKYSNGKVRGGRRPDAQAFVQVAGAPAAGRAVTVRFHGAEIETDEGGLEAVLRAVLALSRSGR